MFPRLDAPLQTALRYGIAVSSVAFALCVGSFLPAPPREPTRSAVFLTSIAISSWVGGRGPGLLAGILSALAIEVFLRAHPELGFTLHGGVRISGFVLASLLISSLNTRRRRAEEIVQANEIEFHIARQIQRKLVPGVPPDIAGFEIFGTSSPANATSGDYFDYFQMPEGRLGIAVGDVSGHGLGPALLMAGTRAYLRVLAQTHDGISEVLAAVNRLLCEDTEDDQFVTLFFACLDPESRSLIYASAGQEGYRLLPNGRATRLNSTGLPLGVDKDCIFDCAPPIEMTPGEIIVFLTDGILEAASADGTRFGAERALDIIRAHESHPCPEIARALWKEVSEFSSHAAQRDDMTMVIIKSKPAEFADEFGRSVRCDSGSASSHSNSSRGRRGRRGKRRPRSSTAGKPSAEAIS